MREEVLPREMLYLADEAFFCGTAVEVTPIRSIDKIAIGSGRRPVTDAIRRTFFDILNGELPDTHGWLTFVYPDEAHLREGRSSPPPPPRAPVSCRLAAGASAHVGSATPTCVARARAKASPPQPPFA